jgi:hypothetical protein
MWTEAVSDESEVYPAICLRWEVESKEKPVKRPGKRVEIRTCILPNRNQRRYRFGLVSLGRNKKRKKGKKQKKTEEKT